MPSFAQKRLPYLATLTRRRLAWLAPLALLGPGLIAANAGNDAGGIATYASVGASYGYSMLWLLVPITIGLIIVQEMCARMAAVTGKGLIDLIRENFGPRWTILAVLTILAANGVTTISEFAGIAAAMELFGVTKYISVPFAAVLVWVLVVRGSYRRIEGVFLLFTIAFFAYPLSTILVQPEWATVGRELIVPSFRLDNAYLVIALATIGTTITTYMQLFVQSAVVERGVTIRDYPATRWDVIIGSLFSNIIALSIIVTTAATLHSSGVAIESAGDAARALEPLAGVYASALFAIGLLGASMLAAGVLPLATAFTITEAFGFEKGVSFVWAEAPIFYGLFSALIAVGALVTLLPGLPLIWLLIFAQVVNGLLLPIMLVFIVRLASDHELMADHANSRWLNSVAWIVVIGIAAVAVVMVVATVILPLFGLQLA